MTEKPITFFPITALIAGVFLALGFPARAQESLVGLGKIYAAGAIESASSPIGATIACTLTATGLYTITFNSPGAFAGASESDFVVDTTIDFVQVIDRASHGYVSSVTADLLTVKVRVSDLEDTAIPDLAVASNLGFMFAVRRTDVLTAGSPMASRLLVATGTVLGNGTLESGFATNGVSLATGRWDVGRYTLRLSKTGAFATDGYSQYILLLSSRSIALPDVSISGGGWNAITDDYMEFQIQTHDIQQSPASNDAVKANAAFSFVVYRIGAEDATGAAATTLLAAAASVDGTTGNLVKGVASFPGATITSKRISQGRYRLTIDAPGAFTGSDSTRFAPFVGLNESGQIDEIAKARVLVTDPDTLLVDVTVDDVQHNGDPDGIDADGSFFLTLYDTAPKLQPDLKVGSKYSEAGARGAGVINQTGAGQSVILPVKGTSRRSAYFRSKNTGSATDGLKLKSGKISRFVDGRFYLTSDGNRNITATVKVGGLVEGQLLPGDVAVVKSTFRYRKTEKRPVARISLQSLSGYQPTSQDTNRITLRPK
jgi:hypothetical protein